SIRCSLQSGAARLRRRHRAAKQLAARLGLLTSQQAKSTWRRAAFLPPTRRLGLGVRPHVKRESAAPTCLPCSCRAACRPRHIPSRTLLARPAVGHRGDRYNRRGPHARSPQRQRPAARSGSLLIYRGSRLRSCSSARTCRVRFQASLDAIPPWSGDRAAPSFPDRSPYSSTDDFLPVEPTLQPAKLLP